ncbi:hypothetical protein HNV27_19555 [Myxococcus xanthus]|nr:hypothetical protein [Myxococcus xanthus]
MGEDGIRHLPVIPLGGSESVESWLELLRQLLEQVLTGVRLVIADGHARLAAAARQALPEAQLQRCTVHLTRNVFGKAPLAAARTAGKADVRHLRAPPPAGRQEATGGPPGGTGAPDARGYGVPAQYQRPGAAPQRGQAPHPLRRRLPGSRQRSAPHHRRRPRNHRRLGRPPLPRHVPAEIKPNHCCLTCSRSFPPPNPLPNNYTRFGT